MRPLEDLWALSGHVAWRFIELALESGYSYAEADEFLERLSGSDDKE